MFTAFSLATPRPAEPQGKSHGRETRVASSSSKTGLSGTSDDEQEGKGGCARADVGGRNEERARRVAVKGGSRGGSDAGSVIIT